MVFEMSEDTRVEIPADKVKSRLFSIRKHLSIKIQIRLSFFKSDQLGARMTLLSSLTIL